jgi:hypothetical protein
MATLTMTIRFLCELAAFGALGWWGRANATGAASIALMVTVPLVAAVWWGLWVAPRAHRRLRDPARFGAELVVWIPATIALLDLMMPAAAIGFAVLSLATALGARRYEAPMVTSPPA